MEEKTLHIIVWYMKTEKPRDDHGLWTEILAFQDESFPRVLFMVKLTVAFVGLEPESGKHRCWLISEASLVSMLSQNNFPSTLEVLLENKTLLFSILIV